MKKPIITLLFSALLLAGSFNSFANDDKDKLVNKASVSLPAGRSITMQPSINNIGHAKGIVSVDVVMDRKGKVVSARANKRTTVKDKTIVRKVEEAVMAMKFDKNKKAPETQTGTLTYTFS